MVEHDALSNIVHVDTDHSLFAACKQNQVHRVDMSDWQWRWWLTLSSPTDCGRIGWQNGASPCSNNSLCNHLFVFLSLGKCRTISIFHWSQSCRCYCLTFVSVVLPSDSPSKQRVNIMRPGENGSNFADDIYKNLKDSLRSLINPFLNFLYKKWLGPE